jgi:2-keto-3-deoxy-L-rhamnonate aldolase RhmA
MDIGLRNRVKDKLARSEVVASMTVRLVGGIEIARLAATAGFDTFYVDLEHSSLSFERAGQICIAGLEIGIAPFVRVPSLRPDHVLRALDGGALGVIAPHVRSAEDARALVQAAKFPPLGTRSASAGLPHFQFRSLPAAEANAALDAATMVVAMMETEAALDRVAEIAAVPGLDMLLVGTSDLTAEMGIAGQYDHPRVRVAYARTIDACRRHGKHVGVGGLASRPDLAAEFVRQGARYVSTGTDLGFLLSAATAKADAVKAIKV